LLFFWRDWLQQRADRVAADLVLLTDSTAVDVILDKCGHPWPPVIPLDKDMGGEASRMSRRHGVVVFLYHVSAEGEVVRYVTSVFVED